MNLTDITYITTKYVKVKMMTFFDIGYCGTLGIVVKVISDSKYDKKQLFYYNVNIKIHYSGYIY